jgi:hypothetical protein
MPTLFASPWWMPSHGGPERGRPPPDGTGTDKSEARSTFGPHAIGAERFLAVSSGTSFAQVAGAILGKQARGQNPDKTPMAGGRHEG